MFPTEPAESAAAAFDRDPADYGSPENSTAAYPHSFWLPDEGIQRGTVTWLDGDPLTYGYPATGNQHCHSSMLLTAFRPLLDF